MIHYLRPTKWITYDATAIVGQLASAKAAVLSLNTVPFQRRWVDSLQTVELKREVAGTSRIEGAEFTEKELDAAMRQDETAADLYTRSQKQAWAATRAYRWLTAIPSDRLVSRELVTDLHGLFISGADDDHCVAGQLRGDGQNVTFGAPKHRGVEGGAECAGTFAAFIAALDADFRGHDPLIQAIAAHYHLAAMHPFMDGNGRTARALEALLLGRAGLRNATFIAMSNYYYDEKNEYLAALASVRHGGHDLTPFLVFALRGVELQARRLLTAIQREIKKELYKNLMIELFDRLQSRRKRVLRSRQKAVLEDLLAADGPVRLQELLIRVLPNYQNLKNDLKAIIRDLMWLQEVRAITFRKDGEVQTVEANLDWPSVMTESDFFQQVRLMPRTGEFATVQR